MRKSAIFLFALLLGSATYAQEQTENFSLSNDKRNELKLNLLPTIFSFHPEISYERILAQELSAGASLGFGGEWAEQTFAFTPYFRWHFGSMYNKAASGFFVEANASLFNDAGIGFAIGHKYVSRNNWVGDLMFGAGRSFDGDGVYPRIGISIGKRF
ncbi:MAG: hypothetical protein LBS52_03800 [Dysgonamonadaceae bacterium]|jgi:hypothetical protein|nr:hypothetical protein [Dysgonamonadaceae bacterium]